MIEVLRYIHQNSIQAGISQTVSGYKWSSDFFYRRQFKGFVNFETVLNMLDNDRNEAVKKYIEFMEENEEKNYGEVKTIGEEAYKLMCLSRRKIEERKRLDEILIDTGISEEDYRLVKS